MDALVVGGGLNGLVAAAALAGAGRRVAVLERRDRVGGLAEVLADTSRVPPGVAAELGLRRAEPAPILVGDLVLQEAPEVVAWRRAIARWKPLARHLVDRPAPRLGADASPWEAVKAAVAFRRLGEADLLELLRVGPLPVEDWLAEHVSDPRLRAALALDGLLGAFMGPLSPGSAATLLLHALTDEGQIAGGAGAVVAAAVEACRARGVELRVGAEVRRIRVRGGAVAGVTLADGEEIDAPVVLSAVDPRRTALSLLAPTDCPPSLEADARAHRCRGIVSVARVEHRGRSRVVEHPHQLERAFDAAKYGRLADDPPIDAHDDLAYVFGTPHDLRGGWTDAARAAVAARVEDRLGARVVAVLAPPDLEATYGCSGGHLFHGEHALDQLWVGRPSLALSGHRAPIDGLFLASSGTHPGGGLTGAPGWHAARAVMS